MDLMAVALMLLAAAIWGYAAFRESDGSEKLECALSGLLLNASAMVLWNLERGPAAMLEHWLPFALAAACSTLLLHLCAAMRQEGRFAETDSSVVVVTRSDLAERRSSPLANRRLFKKSSWKPRLRDSASSKCGSK